MEDFPWTTLWSILVPVGLLLAGGGYLFYQWITKSRLEDEQKVASWEVFITGISAVTLVVGGALAVVQYIHQSSREAARHHSAQEQLWAQMVEEQHRFNRQQEQLEEQRIHEQQQFRMTWEREIKERREDLAYRTREFNINLYQGPAGTVTPAALYHEVVDVVSTIATSSSISDQEDFDVQLALRRFDRLYYGQLAMIEDDLVETAMVEIRRAVEEWKDSGNRPVLTDNGQLDSLLAPLSETLANNAKAGGSKAQRTFDVFKEAKEIAALRSQGHGSKTSERDKLLFLSVLLAHACRHELMQQSAGG